MLNEQIILPIKHNFQRLSGFDAHPASAGQKIAERLGLVHLNQQVAQINSTIQ